MSRGCWPKAHCQDQERGDYLCIILLWIHKIDRLHLAGGKQTVSAQISVKWVKLNQMNTHTHTEAWRNCRPIFRILFFPIPCVGYYCPAHWTIPMIKIHLSSVRQSQPCFTLLNQDGNGFKNVWLTTKLQNKKYIKPSGEKYGRVPSKVEEPIILWCVCTLQHSHTQTERRC